MKANKRRNETQLGGQLGGKTPAMEKSVQVTAASAFFSSENCAVALL